MVKLKTVHAGCAQPLCTCHDFCAQAVELYVQLRTQGCDLCAQSTYLWLNYVSFIAWFQVDILGFKNELIDYDSTLLQIA